MLNPQNLGLRPRNRERREELCVMNIVFVVGCCLFIELKVVTNEMGEAVGEVVTIIC
jgi:hypothetical protein